MKTELSIFNSKDLLKILPSYLIEEVDNISNDSYKLSAHSFNTPEIENFHNVSKIFLMI